MSRDEQSFLVGKASCHFEGFRVGDLHDLVGKAPIKGLRIEVLADASIWYWCTSFGSE